MSSPIQLRRTLTGSFAVMEISAEAYDEIVKLLREAGYDHLLRQQDGPVDMSGIAIERGPYRGS